MKKIIKRIIYFLIAVTQIIFTSCQKNYKKFVWPENCEKGMISVDGGEIPYRLYGKDKKATPIIFVHGGPGGQYSKFYTLLPLSNERPVLFYNQLGGHGSKFDENHNAVKSSHEIMTIDHYVNELQNVIDYFGFDRFILYGQSWGSMLSVEYAATKKPRGLEKMILSGPFLSVDVWISDAERLIKTLPDGKNKWEYITKCINESKINKDIFVNDKKYNEINDEYSVNFAMRNTKRKNEIPDSEIIPKVLDEEKGVLVDVDTYNYMWGPSEFTCNGTLLGTDVTNRLSDITCPILYISGEYDSGTPEAAEYYNSKTKNGKVVVIKNAGHSSYVDNKEAVLNAVNLFIK